MNIFKFFLVAHLFLSLNVCVATTLMPLTTWMQGKEFSTLSVYDTVTVTLRCSAAYDVNRVILEEFSNYKADGLRERVEKHRRVSSAFSALLMKDKKKTDLDNYQKSYLKQANAIYDAYFDAIKNSQPIPHSISNALLAGDIGVCNELDQTVFDAYTKMYK
jgi:hypothetical protein